jgi:hypothetical protein
MCPESERVTDFGTLSDSGRVTDSGRVEVGKFTSHLTPREAKF